MKKRILSLMLLGVIVSNTSVYAVENVIKNENNELETITNEDEKIIGNYERKIKDNNELKKSIEENDYFNRKEVLDDANGTESVKEIIQKTEKKYEIAIAHDNGEFEYVYSSDNLEEIKDKKANLNIKNLVIINDNKVVYSDYSMGRVIKHINNNIASITEITKVYQNSTTKNEHTYYNHGYIDDVPVIEYANNRVKIQIGSYTGWVDQDIEAGNFEVILTPLNQIKNPSHFINDNGILKHYISSDLMIEGKGNYIYLGQAPEYMEKGKKYYSYDKEYFYTDLYKLIDDLKNNTKNNSINSNAKFSSYFEYLSFRSKSSLNAEEINKFIENNTDNKSKLRNIGNALKQAEEKYGVNSLALLGIAINESGWGMSKIAQEKNNIFGINAKDSSPGQSANHFASVEKCIDEFAQIWISNGYSNPNDWRYNSAILGNKKVGTNVRYASDPFWGEKATNHMFNIGKNEIGKLSLGEAKKGSAIFDENLKQKYILKNNENYLVINEKTKVDGKEYYKVNTELSENGVYDWNNISLISSEDINIIWDNGKLEDENKPETNSYWEYKGDYWYLYDQDGNIIKGMVEKDGYKYYLDEQTGRMRTGWVIYDNQYYYFGSSGEMKTGWINDGWTDYYLKSDGTIHKGWLDDGMYKYYMDSNGQLQRGWVKDNNEYYYFGSNGEMKTGWINDGWTDYYLKSDGTIYKGWLDDGMYKYYLDENGQMKKGWHKDKNDWYYFGVNGEMKTGWINDGYGDYFMMSDGKLKPEIDIVDLGLEFDFGVTGPEVNKPDKIILHHAAGNATVQSVHNYHKNGNGWAGIGYHFYIHKDGTIYKGRNEEWRGAHAAEVPTSPNYGDGILENDVNATSIGISVQGDYMNEKNMPKVQEEAIVKVGKYLVKKYGISQVFKHGDNGIGQTNCPGKYYPFERVKSKILSGAVYGVYKDE